MEIKSAVDFMLMTRAALAAAGFVRKEIDGTVYFEGGGQTILSVRTDKIVCPPLVLIHGVNDHAGTWFLVAPALAQKYRVIIPDLPGHGESKPKDGPLPISLMVSKLAAIIGNQRVTLLGNSLGGWLAMLYALAHPDNVARLILEAPGGLSLPLDSPTTAHDRDEAMVILRNVHGPRFQPPEWAIEALLQRAVSSPMLRVSEVLEHVVDERLKDIHVPASILWGADDGVVPRSYVEALQQGIPHATLQVIEGAAHIPHLQQPERFLQCLTSIS